MAGSEPVADAEEQDIGVAVVVRQDPAPREASGPVAPDPVARGHREDARGEGIVVSLALLVHGDVHAEAGAEREPVAEKARLVPTLRHDAVAPDEVRVALVEPGDRAPERGTEGVPVLDARGDRVVVLGAQAVDDGRAGEQRQLVALRRRARRRAAVDGLVILVQLVADAEDELRRVDAFLRLDVVEPHLVEPAPRAAPGRSRAVEHAVAVRVGVVAGALAGSYGSVVVAVGAGARGEAEPRAERRGLGPELQRLAVAVVVGDVPLVLVGEARRQVLAERLVVRDEPGGRTLALRSIRLQRAGEAVDLLRRGGGERGGGAQPCCPRRGLPGAAVTLQLLWLLPPLRLNIGGEPAGDVVLVDVGYVGDCLGPCDSSPQCAQAKSRNVIGLWSHFAVAAGPAVVARRQRPAPHKYCQATPSVSKSVPVRA